MKIPVYEYLDNVPLPILLATLDDLKRGVASRRLEEQLAPFMPQAVIVRIGR